MAAEARLVVNELVQMTNYAWGTPVTWTRLVYDGRQRLRVRQEYTWQDTATNPGPESLTLGLGGRGAAALARPGGGSSPWQLTSETRYIYDGMRVIQERDGNNVPVVSYTRGTDLGGSLEGAGGIGGLLARTANSQLPSANAHAFYHADGNGNVTYLVDSSQGLAASYRYDAYGNTLAASGSLATANVYRFSSKEIHVLTGLYYYGYRWYAPDLQRWVNRDPIGESGFEALDGRKASILAGGLNRFRFARNSPVDFYDPFGLKSTTSRCKPADEKRIRESLKAACKKFESPAQCQVQCLRNSLPADPAGGDPAGLALVAIRKFCKNKVDNDKVEIQCDYSDSTAGCKTSDGAYGDHDSTMTFCSNYFNGTTAKNGYSDDCVAIHEIAHWGFGTSPTELDKASAYDKCFGCPGRTH